jgi:hypothetical protein
MSWAASRVETLAASSAVEARHLWIPENTPWSGYFRYLVAQRCDGNVVTADERRLSSSFAKVVVLDGEHVHSPRERLALRAVVIVFLPQVPDLGFQRGDLLAELDPAGGDAAARRDLGVEAGIYGESREDYAAAFAAARKKLARRQDS